MKKNVFEVSIGTGTQSFSNKKGTESKQTGSPSTARKLTYDILRPREASAGPGSPFVVHRPTPLEDLPSLETPRKNPLFKVSAQVIDSLTKLNEFRSSSQKAQPVRSEPVASSHQESAKTREEARQIAPSSQHELVKTREETRKITTKSYSQECDFKDQITRLERENENLRQKADKERTASKVSLRLIEIETQNSKIIEGLQNAKTSLIDREKTHIERIQALKRENAGLEQELFALRKKAYDCEIGCSKVKNLEDHLDLVMLEMGHEKRKIATLNQSHAFLAEQISSAQEREARELAQISALQGDFLVLKEENAKFKAERAEARERRGHELRAITDRVEQLSQQLSEKKEEARLLGSQLQESYACSSAQSRQGESVLEELDEENVLLSQMLGKLQKKYETVQRVFNSERLRSHLSFAAGPKPRTEDKDYASVSGSEASVDRRAILSSAENGAAGQSLGDSCRAPNSATTREHTLQQRDHGSYTCSFKKFNGDFFGKEDSYPPPTTGQGSGKDTRRAFTPRKDEFSSAKKVSLHTNSSDKFYNSRKPGCSPIKRVILNQLLSEEKGFLEKEGARQKHIRDYSLQDETTFLSMDASGPRAGENLFYPPSFQNR